MDRLSALAIVVALAACEGGDAKPADQGRVNAAKGVTSTITAEEWCDVHADAERAPAFTMPALAGPAPPPASSWRWVNIWATWCKPCLEEMPRLVTWRGRLGIDVVFVSADESDEVIATHRAAHPETPESVRLAAPDDLPTWLTALGLDAAASIPVHVLVDPHGKTRCVRAGGVRDADLAVVQRLLGR